MAAIDDQDRFFSGSHDSSTSKYLLPEGTVARLLNGRFIEGAITNAIGFDELTFNYVAGNDTRVFASKTTYGEILRRGDVQLAAPLSNTSGNFIVAVISGILFLLDVETCTAYDITPANVCLPTDSSEGRLSYIDNDGGTYGTGGYLVIFNYPSLPIFVNQFGARTARPQEPFWEMPVSRLGASAGNRTFVVQGSNLLWASDPLGGASGLAPLTFQQTLDPNGQFTDQIFTIGSVLDIEYITALCRIPKFLGPSQDFIAQSLLVSTRNKKYIVTAGAPRDTWQDIQFITYAGVGEGVAGPLACTNVGDNILYISTGGRIKTIAQDQEGNSTLQETFIDDPLGQYLCPCEPSLYYRDWYRDLDHSHSIIKFFRDRVFATTYPTKAKAIDKFGQRVYTPTHRALAVASLDSTTQLGPRARLSWEGFYDWLNPASLVRLEDDFYVLDKQENYGLNKYYRVNYSKLDDHNTTVYTRGYLGAATGKGRGLLGGSLFFRRLAGKVKVRISYLINDEWICGSECEVDKPLHRFRFTDHRCTADSWGVPLKIDIEHNGCRFELESIRVDGEQRRDN
jgi:hypothetical protein